MKVRFRYGQYSFKVGSIGRLPNDLIGIYSFWYRGKCIYIGQAKNQPLKDRLWQHFKRCHNSSLNMWIDAYGKELLYCCVRLPYGRIDMLERKLIKRHQPRANVHLKK